MARTTIAEVQVWISDNRVTVASGDLLDQIEDYVLGRLESTHDTSGWADDTDTPDLVRQVIALLDAEAKFRKDYSDQEDELPYADKLGMMAEARLEQIIGGQLTLTVGTVVLTSTQADAVSAAAGPTIFPTEGERLQDSYLDPTATDGKHRAAFHMGEIF